MKLELLPAQQWLTKPTPGVKRDIALYQGGFGSGKTWQGCWLGLRLLERYWRYVPDLTLLVGAASFSMLRDVVIRQYLRHLHTMGFRPKIHYHYNKTEHSITLPYWNNATIFFRSLHDPESVRGIEAAFGHLDEASLISEYAFNEFSGRIRQPGVPIHRIWGGTNPQANKGWIYKMFEEKAGIREETLPDASKCIIEYRRVIASSVENHHLDPSTIASWRTQFDAELFKIYVLGQDGDFTSGLVCHTYGPANLSPYEYNPRLPLYLTCDFNVDPNCWIVGQFVNGNLYFFDEICLENTTTQQCADVFARRYQGHGEVVYYTGDASGNNRNTMSSDPNATNYTIIANTLSEFGFRRVEPMTPTSNPYIIDRVVAWNAAMCNRDGVRRVYIHPTKCPQLKYNCENLMYIPGTSEIRTSTKKEIEKDAKLKFIEHPFAAASYLVYQLFPIQWRPNPGDVVPKFTTSRYPGQRSLSGGFG